MRKKMFTVLAGVFLCSVITAGMAYAGCKEDIQALAARLTTQGGNQQNPEMASIQSAFALLDEAQAKCQQGDETGSAALLEQLRSLLASMGR